MAFLNLLRLLWLNACLDSSYHHQRSCEIWSFVFMPKQLRHQNSSTDWEASVVNLNYFERFVDSSWQHAIYTQNGPITKGGVNLRLEHIPCKTNRLTNSNSYMSNLEELLNQRSLYQYWFISLFPTILIFLSVWSSQKGRK